MSAKAHDEQFFFFEKTKYDASFYYENKKVARDVTSDSAAGRVGAKKNRAQTNAETLRIYLRIYRAVEFPFQTFRTPAKITNVA